MRVLVTGGSGFLGRNLLLRAPDSWEIVATYFKSKNFEQFVALHELGNVTTVRVDLTNPGETRKAFGRKGLDFDLLLHLAANTDVPFSVKNPQSDLQSNVGTLLYLITTVRTNELLYLSSGAVYDGLKGSVGPRNLTCPSFPYAISKLAGENYVRYAKKNGFIENFTILRFFGAYGPYEPARKIFTRLVRRFAIEKKASFEIVGNGRNLIDAMYVTDAVNGIMATANSSRRNLTVDFTSGNPLSIRQLVRSVAKIFGFDSVKIISGGKPVEYNEFHASPDEMQRLCSFRPQVKLEQGIQRLHKWLLDGHVNE